MVRYTSNVLVLASSARLRVVTFHFGGGTGLTSRIDSAVRQASSRLPCQRRTTYVLRGVSFDEVAATLLAQTTIAGSLEKRLEGEACKNDDLCNRSDIRTILMLFIAPHISAYSGPACGRSRSTARNKNLGHAYTRPKVLPHTWHEYGFSCVSGRRSAAIRQCRLAESKPTASHVPIEMLGPREDALTYVTL